MNDNIILIDWFAFTIRYDTTVNDVITMLGLNGLKWLDLSGHYGYKTAKYSGGIWIMSDGGRENMGICVEMSGQGCRQFESSSNLSFGQLFEIVLEDPEGYHVTRLDVAYDDVDKEGSGLLDMVKIVKSAYFGRYISKFRKSKPEIECEVDEDGHVRRAHTCYFGSASSEVRIRFYDKAAERGYLPYHWTRCELQMRRDAAVNFLKASGGYGERFFGVINNYLRFIKPDKSDSNRRRWPSPKWWSDFLKAVGRISLYTPKGVDYNLTRLEQYLFTQCGNSIETYIECVGILKFKEMLKHRDSLLNANQQALIDEYKAINDEKTKGILW